MTPLWAIRLLFLLMCMAGGYAISQVRPEFIAAQHSGLTGIAIGFGFGGLLIAVDEMLKGFSLRAFSATTFGLLLGTVVAMLVDHSGLFENVDERTRWMIRLCLFLSFGYIGIILAIRSNKEDFSLIIPYVRFSPQNKPDNLLILDTSVIVDGRIADLIDAKYVEGLIVVPRFVPVSSNKSPIPAIASSAPAAGAAWKCSTAFSAMAKSKSAFTMEIFPKKKRSTPSWSGWLAT
jgi:uncharacterized protein YacL